MRMTDEEAVLRKMGIDFQTPAPGCCGMAGSFGFERDKYETSIAIGELELLPAVRRAAPDCLVIANGFSCREQIAQCTGRRTLHLAEVIQIAAREGSTKARTAAVTKLSSNRHLYDYLLSLSAELNTRGSGELSAVAGAASQHAWGMSTEFLGESRIALRRVLREEAGILSENERVDLLNVLQQLDSALDKR